ncbi:DUF1003 domain-containing protein [soil metagenome]
MAVTFPPPFQHDHPPVRNVDAEEAKALTFGEKAADAVAARVGSWRFIIIQSMLLIVWVTLNLMAWVQAWDPYPFILLNLFLSLQAAYTAPMLMMSQNRQADLDRLRAEHDYEINLKAEAEIRHVLLHLEAQNEALMQMQQDLTKLIVNHIAEGRD